MISGDIEWPHDLEALEHGHDGIACCDAGSIYLPVRLPDGGPIIGLRLLGHGQI
jgi:hypothetical protein